MPGFQNFAVLPKRSLQPITKVLSRGLTATSNYIKTTDSLKDQQTQSKSKIMADYRRNPFDGPSLNRGHEGPNRGSYPSQSTSGRTNDGYNRGGYGSYQNNNQGDRGGYGANNGRDMPPRRNNDFDQVDGNLMRANAGTLGLDPSKMAPIKKNLYNESEEVASMGREEIELFRKNAQMTIQGGSIPKPVISFSQVSAFPEAVKNKLAAQGLTKPTPIQAQGWSMALSGQNMVGIAQTGSGKTLSFVLPAIAHALNQAPLRQGDGPIVLVLAPTRELAVQIQEVARIYGSSVRIQSTCLYGGSPKGPQLRAIRSGAEIVVATPGRLLDLLNEHHFTLQRVSFLVLDEADRMLDMGFEPQIRKILQMIRLDRQVLMWSATWPKNVMRLAHDMLGRDFIQVKIGSAELMANKKINQQVIVCDEHQKMEHLNRILNQLWDSVEGSPETKQMPRTIVFANKKRVVDNVVRALYHDRWPVVAIHGDKSQGERDHAIRTLKSGQTAILVATDVAARGLDVTGIMAVINFDMPDDIENYVHRIGRTARGDAKEGAAYSFVNPSVDGSVISDLVKIMEDAGQEVSDDLRSLVRRSGGSSGGRSRRGGFSRGRGGGNFNRSYGGGYPSAPGEGPKHTRFAPY